MLTASGRRLKENGAKLFLFLTLNFLYSVRAHCGSGGKNSGIYIHPKKKKRKGGNERKEK